MSAQEPAQSTEDQAAPAREPAPPARCPRCGTELAPGQEWCLECGTAARTVIAPPPSWRLPIALVAVVVALCGAALAWAFVTLTDNDADVRAAVSAPTTATTAPPAATTPPAATPPAATTPPPAATPPAATPPADEGADPGAAPPLP